MGFFFGEPNNAPEIKIEMMALNKATAAITASSLRFMITSPPWSGLDLSSWAVGNKY